MLRKINKYNFDSGVDLGSRAAPGVLSSQAFPKWLVALVAIAWSCLIQNATSTSAADGDQSSRVNNAGRSQPTNDLGELGKLALEGKRFQEAASLYTQALRRDPSRVDCLVGRAKALEMCDLPHKALQDYKRALEIDPNNTLAMIAAAGILEMGGGTEKEALSLYKAALSMTSDPGSREKISFNIAVLETRVQDELLSAVGCWNLGTKQLTKGKLNDAEDLFSKALELNPHLYQAYYSRALTRLKKNDIQSALQDLSSTVDLCPSLRGCLVTRGLVYESLGMLTEALADMKRAATMDARDPNAHYHLGRLQERQGAYAEALASYLEAMNWRPKPDLRDSIRQRITTLAGSVKLAPRQPATTPQPKPSLW